MKSTKIIIINILLSTIMLAPSMAIAFNGGTAVPGASAQATGTSDAQTKAKIDEIFKIEEFQMNGKKGNQQLKDLTKQVNSNQESTFADVFASIIKILSGLAVVMTFVGAIVAGVLFVFSEGEEARTTKAKTILIYVAIGDLIIAASYAIVRGITLIKPLS